MNYKMNEEQKKFWDSLQEEDFLIYDNKEVLVVSHKPFPGEGDGTFRDYKWTGQIWYPPNFKMFKKGTYRDYIDYAKNSLLMKIDRFDHLKLKDKELLNHAISSVNL